MSLYPGLPSTFDAALDRSLSEYFYQLEQWDHEGAAPKFPPKDIDKLYAVAYVYYKNGQYTNALPLLQLLTMVDPQVSKYWLGLGASQQMLKEYAEAFYSYTCAAMMDKDNPYPHLYAADCLFAMDKVDLGLQIIDEVGKMVASDEQYQGIAHQIDIIKQAWSLPQSVQATSEVAYG